LRVVFFAVFFAAGFFAAVFFVAFFFAAGIVFPPSEMGREQVRRLQSTARIVRTQLGGA
jgi:UPF0716 family protein affecting phage T7 exclusion